MAFPYGNYSNRLFQNLHFEAFCKEYGIEYINPSFSDIYDLYKSPCNLVKGLKYIKKYELKIKIIKKLKIYKFIKIFDTENDNYRDSLLSNPSSFKHNIYVGGWCFRVQDLTEKYQDYFIEKYTLKEKYYLNNKFINLINKTKRSNKIVVGVHIRRGDYKDWQNGKYYFNDTVYEKYIYTLKELFSEIKNECIFIIFSNENLLLEENEYIYKSTNEWYIDHLLMSRCDYLIGPPSTFTLWASYIGKVKYFHIENDSMNINLNDFKYCKG